MPPKPVSTTQIDALLKADIALGDRIDKEVAARVTATTSLANRTSILEDQVKVLLVAGGGGGGTTPIENPPPPPPPPDITPPTISDFTISGVTETGANLACQTNEASTVIFEYGLTTAYGSQTTATASGTSHSKTLSGLTAGRTYHVRARATDTAGNGPTLSSDRTFTTPAASGGEVVALFPGSGSNSPTAFRALVANMNIDAIEMTTASYAWHFLEIAVDRTSRPLTIRPASGATVTFTDPSGNSGVFVTAKNDGSAIAKWITFDGGASRGFVFDGIGVAQAGVLQIFGSFHFTFKSARFRNLARVGTSDQPYKSWIAYINDPYGIGGLANDFLVLDDFICEEPAVNRDVSAFQVATGGSHGTIDITNMDLDGYYYAMWVDRPVTDLTLNQWAVNDCGIPPGDTSLCIRFRVANINGSYSNITATASGALENASTGVMVDGGGNSIP
jgi:hypothetical protein